jgi:hypothetical protein
MPIPSSFKEIRIVSEGIGAETQIQTTDGVQLKTVTDATVYIDVSRLNTISLTMIGGSVDIIGIPGTTTFDCPLCDHVCDHDCKETTLGRPHKHD